MDIKELLNKVFEKYDEEKLEKIIENDDFKNIEITINIRIKDLEKLFEVKLDDKMYEINGLKKVFKEMLKETTNKTSLEDAFKMLMDEKQDSVKILKDAFKTLINNDEELLDEIDIIKSICNMKIIKNEKPSIKDFDNLGFIEIKKGI